MTLKEIASEAGVSISTVSRVINKNGTNAASKEVQNRIWEIVRRTGYTPNTAARNLKHGITTAAEMSPALLPACLPERTPSVTCSFPHYHAALSRRLSSVIMY